MTSIYKTAYPYYSQKKKIDKAIIIRDYQLTREEIIDIRKRMPNNDNSQLSYAVLLVVFKNLNYFPELSSIPNDIIDYVREQLQLPSIEFNAINSSAISRYRKRIYNYFGVQSWGATKLENGETIYPVQVFAENVAAKASKIHN